ncbi:hypothetical protein BKA62DRAFT_674191 [Auriculariales sp. MPI-PUGE-AT-0066]|nr:hypothetical protein BKA62DRAFT_674191 [Auriculariales sp. MPI-PUGE-AT-0066]
MYGRDDPSPVALVSAEVDSKRRRDRDVEERKSILDTLQPQHKPAQSTELDVLDGDWTRGNSPKGSLKGLDEIVHLTTFSAVDESDGRVRRELLRRSSMHLPYEDRVGPCASHLAIDSVVETLCWGEQEELVYPRVLPFSDIYEHDFLLAHGSPQIEDSKQSQWKQLFSQTRPFAPMNPDTLLHAIREGGKPRTLANRVQTTPNTLVGDLDLYRQIYRTMLYGALAPDPAKTA